MCLDNIKTEHLPVITEGFKVFKRVRRNGKWKLIGVHKNWCEYTKRKWMVDTSVCMISSTSDSFISIKYLTGFHCFLNKEDAIKYSEKDEVIHRVLVDDVRAVGEQGFYPSFSARRIYIVEEIPREGELKWKEEKNS